MNKLLITFLLPINIMYAHSLQHKLHSMSLEEKIGQLLIIQSPVNPQEKHINAITTALATYKPGGIIFLGKGTIEPQIKATNHYQKTTSMPLLIAQDLEWGLQMRFTDGFEFPKNVVLGHVSNELVYEVAREIGKQTKALGVHINIAPVVDVNSNPKNPIIGTRSFGDNKEVVAQKGIHVAKGLQSRNIVACAKHFPGHGDTQIDSHVDMPIINKSLHELEDTELYPFKQLIKNGIDCIMTAHLVAKGLDDSLPATISKPTLDYLRNTLGFKGLLISDALNMQGILKNRTQPQAAALALKAGNDMVILASDAPGLLTDKLDDVEFYERVLSATIKEIKLLLTEEEINAKVGKILMLKDKLALDKKPIVYNKELFDNQHSKDLKQQVYNQLVTSQLKKTKSIKNAFTITEEDYHACSAEQLENAEQIVLHISAQPKSILRFHAYEFDTAYKQWVDELIAKYCNKVLVILYGNHIAVQDFKTNAIIYTYDNNEYARIAIKNIL